MLVALSLFLIAEYAQGSSYVDVKENGSGNLQPTSRALFQPIEEENFFEANGLEPIVWTNDYKWEFKNQDVKCLVPVNLGKCDECPYPNLSSAGDVCYLDADARTDSQPCMTDLGTCCDGTITSIQANPRTCHYNSIAPFDDYVCYYPTFDGFVSRGKCHRCPEHRVTAQYDTLVCLLPDDIILCYDTIESCCQTDRIDEHEECLEVSLVPENWHLRDCFEITSAKYSLTNFDCFQLCIDFITRGDTNVTLFRNIRDACPQTIATGMHLVDLNVSFPMVVSKYFDQWSHGHTTLVDEMQEWNYKEIWATSPAMCQAECQTYDWCVKFHYVLYTDAEDTEGRYVPNACFLKNLDQVRGAYEVCTDDPFYNEEFCPIGLDLECHYHPWNCTVCENHPRCIWRVPYLLTGWVYSADWVDPCLIPVGPLPKDAPFPL